MKTFITVQESLLSNTRSISNGSGLDSIRKSLDNPELIKKLVKECITEGDIYAKLTDIVIDKHNQFIRFVYGKKNRVAHLIIDIDKWGKYGLPKHIQFSTKKTKTEVSDIHFCIGLESKTKHNIDGYTFSIGDKLNNMSKVFINEKTTFTNCSFESDVIINVIDDLKPDSLNLVNLNKHINSWLYEKPELEIGCDIRWNQMDPTEIIPLTGSNKNTLKYRSDSWMLVYVLHELKISYDHKEEIRDNLEHYYNTELNKDKEIPIRFSISKY